MSQFQIGQFVKVGEDFGIVVSSTDSIPEGHCAVWYGEVTSENGQTCPKVRTVPQEYCMPFKNIIYYH